MGVTFRFSEVYDPRLNPISAALPVAPVFILT